MTWSNPTEYQRRASRGFVVWRETEFKNLHFAWYKLSMKKYEAQPFHFCFVLSVSFCHLITPIWASFTTVFILYRKEYHLNPIWYDHTAARTFSFGLKLRSFALFNGYIRFNIFWPILLVSISAKNLMGSWLKFWFIRSFHRGTMLIERIFKP